MLRSKEILSTVRMFQEENLDVRAVTLGIHLMDCSSPDIDQLCRKVDRKILEGMKGMVWRNCVLCGRCYCPIGVHVPSMIAFTRAIFRSQGIYPEVDETLQESWL